MAFLAPTNMGILFGLVALYGGMSYTLYPIIVAHANDYADADKFVTVSSGLLLLYGIGTIIGPTVSGILMAGDAPYRLFLVTGIAHLSIAAYAIYRSTRRAAIPADNRETFASVPASRSATPESIALDPRANPAE